MIAELLLAGAAAFSMPTGQIGAGRCALINGGILNSYETGGEQEIDVFELRAAPDRGVWIDGTIGVDIGSGPGTGVGGDSWTAVIVDEPVSIDTVRRAAPIYPAREEESLALQATSGVTSGNTWPWTPVGSFDNYAIGFSVQGGGYWNLSQFVEPRFYVGPGQVLYLFTSQELTPFTVMLYVREDILPGETGTCTIEPDSQRRLAR